MISLCIQISSFMYVCVCNKKSSHTENLKIYEEDLRSLFKKISFLISDSHRRIMVEAYSVFEASSKWWSVDEGKVSNLRITQIYTHIYSGHFFLCRVKQNESQLPSSFLHTLHLFTLNKKNHLLKSSLSLFYNTCMIRQMNRTMTHPHTYTYENQCLCDCTHNIWFSCIIVHVEKGIDCRG